jgi:autotransporter-associated beta strand protein
MKLLNTVNNIRDTLKHLALALPLGAALFSGPAQVMAENTWKNGSTNYLWDTSSTNWTSPTAWTQGGDALFDATGADPSGLGTLVTLGEPITAHNITVNATNYTWNSPAGHTLTLSGATPTLTAGSLSNVLGVALRGTDGLTVLGTSPTHQLTFAGNVEYGDLNNYSGPTYVRSGTLVLAQKIGSGGTAVTSGFTIPGIDALDTGATVKFYNAFDGANNVRAANGQIDKNNHLIMTGGTFDVAGEDGWQQVPAPSGTGLILNGSEFADGGLKMFISTPDTTVTFYGTIADGGPVTNSPIAGKLAHRVNIDLNSIASGSVFELAGSNSYSRDTRIGSGLLRMVGEGTLGIPTTNTPNVGLRINGNNTSLRFDLNGTSQRASGLGGNGGIIANNAADTVSVLTLGAVEGATDTSTPSWPSAAAGGMIVDNTTGAGGVMALTKVGTNTQILAMTTPNTYSGPTRIDNGVLVFSTEAAVSVNTDIHINSPGILGLSNNATAHGLYLNGVRMPAGTYGSAQTAAIAGAGTLTVLPPNIWNNLSGNFQWDRTSANWTTPTTWLAGSDAVFGATGVGAVTLGTYVSAHDITFTAPGYSLTGNGYSLTLMDSNATITANQSVSIAASIQGTNGLIVQGTGTNTLLGEGTGNQYTGGTYVKSGTLILQCANPNAAGSAYAVDSIEAIDPGAVVRFGTTNDGLDTATSNVRPPNGQISFQGSFVPVHRLNLTGGTYDTNGDDNQDQVPQPSGFGTIINTSPYARGICKFVSQNGATTTFAGHLMDGGFPTIPRANNGPGYQLNLDSQGVFNSAGTLVLSGSNSFSGFVRIGNNGTIRFSGAGTMGNPPPTYCQPRHVIQNNGTFDFNGTSQKAGVFWTKGDGSPCALTNTAVGTLSTLTLCYNTTNQTMPTQSGSCGGISCSIKDDPATSGLIGITKEGAGIQGIGGVDTVNGTQGTPANNYHGDTVVNNGILAITNAGAISPNSAYRLNTTQGKLRLDYAGTAHVRQLWIDGLQKPNGTYGVAETTAIGGAGTLTVTGYAPVALGFSSSGSALNLSWAGVYKLQVKTNSLSGTWADYPGGGTSPVSIPVDKTKLAMFFRLSTY